MELPADFPHMLLKAARQVPAVLSLLRCVLTPDAVPLLQCTKRFSDTSEQIVVGCMSGKRSAKAIEMLQALQYTNLFNVQSGFNAWLSAGLPVEK